jgi:hypothetical protein
MKEIDVTSIDEDDDNEFEGYMNFGDGAILSIEELLTAMVALDKQKEIEYISG